MILNGEDPHCRALRDEALAAASRAGRDAAPPALAEFRHDAVADGAARDLVLGDWTTTFTLGGAAFTLNVPGRHNVANAMAAIAVGRRAGVSLADCARGLAAYRGVERRHVRIGEARGITVVDDFAHNPAKVKACLETVKASARAAEAADGKPHRVLAVFHPHGFAPMKLIGEDMVEAMAEALGPEDRVFMPEIYYAGGTADKSISSADLIASLHRRPPIGACVPTKDEVIAALAREARPGDWLVTMGARDPSLGDFARKLFQTLGS